MERQIDRYGKTDRQTCRDRQTDMQRQIGKHVEADRQTCRDIQTDMQRQIDKHVETDRQKTGRQINSYTIYLLYRL